MIAGETMFGAFGNQEYNAPTMKSFGGIYASDVYWEKNPHSMASNAERIAKQGIRTIKVHLGCQPPEKEVERVRIIRESIGPEVSLMVDLKIILRNSPNIYFFLFFCSL